MTRKALYVGIDVANAKLDVAFLDAQPAAVVARLEGDVTVPLDDYFDLLELLRVIRDDVAFEAGAAGVDSVAALLALQAEGGATDGRSRGAARAESLLDRLDQLKLALLEGGAVTSRLKELAAAAAQAREETGDPRLDSILNEVEVRAAVDGLDLAVGQDLDEVVGCR